ncbi:universal stress protein [Azospirillum doebereinerae]|uniref:Universal stress protein n=1 Tax=Azospirillum doebereinerae TaxID=92933 RepID=A0A3S0V130_9PROT|nr:universal stress protein [Azospirillum doebereinerae]RUQ70670.1 universal stress protein [Azospirillum doebereinerae]
MATLRRILLATDLEPKSDRAMERAVRLASQFGAELTALHVVRDGDRLYGAMPLHHVEMEIRRHLLATPGAAGIATRAVAVKGEAVGPQVAGYAETWQPDLVVVGHHQRDGVTELFLPATAERIAIADETPLLIVRAKPLGPYARPLVPVDFSERSRPSVAAARLLAPDGRLDLLHVFDVPAIAHPPATRLDTTEFADDFRALLDDAEAIDRTVTVEVRTGSPPPQIVAAARNGRYDLVVMGSARRNGLSRAVLGSVAHEVLDGLPCDTLITGESPSTNAPAAVLASLMPWAKA